MVKYANIIKAIDEYILKCSRNKPLPSSGLIRNYDSNINGGQIPKKNNLTLSQLNKIADEMAKQFNLEVSINQADGKDSREISENQFRLWDNENQTLIDLSNMIEYQNMIDFTNLGTGLTEDHRYNLEEVLGYYTGLDEVTKKSIGGLTFDMDSNVSYTQLYEEGVGFNSIHMGNTLYYTKYGENGMKQTLAHEGGHSSEVFFTEEQKKVLIKSWNPIISDFDENKLTTTEEKEILGNIDWDIQCQQISFSKEYYEAMNNNKEFYASQYSSSQPSQTEELDEDFAETMSAVRYRNEENKSNFGITYENGETVDWDTFVADHKYTYQLCCDYVDGKIKHTDLHHISTDDKFN